MLKLTIEKPELYDEIHNEFIPPKTVNLSLEHSLVSISKWESRWHKPFLAATNKTNEEVIDYIKCMTMTQNVEDDIYNYINPAQYAEISSYINDEMTATKISNQGKKTGREIVTSELVYYWMIVLNIPMECQKWHFNRLLTLINVCNIKNTPPKKMSHQEIAQRNRDLNAKRKQALGTGG